MNKSITLDSVATEFERWRRHKKPNERIPTQLWDLVKEIYHHYRQGQICQRLHISTGQLARHGLIATHPAKTKSKPTATATTFINIEPASPIPTNNLPCVEIYRPDGVQLVIKFPNASQAALFVNQLIGQTS